MILIREATLEDVVALIKLKKSLLEFYDSIGDEKQHYSSIQKYIKQHLKEDTFLVACDTNNHNEIVGMMRLCKKEQKYLDKPCYYLLISDFIIDEKLRGKGVGTRLLDKAKELCKKMSCKYVKLRVKHYNKDAFDFYVRKGFKIQTYNMIFDNL